MNIQGKLIEKFETQVVSEKFKKREFVIEFAENPNYPEFIKFELTQDRVSLIDPYQIGDMIEVSFNLRGRVWINPQGVKNYFNSLQAWRINPVTVQAPPATPTAVNSPAAGYQAPSFSGPQYAPVEPTPEADDFPF